MKNEENVENPCNNVTKTLEDKESNTNLPNDAKAQVED